MNRNAGVAQSLRNMIELASLELVGKTTRVPYWNCLGLTPNQPEIKREIDDWFFSMRDDGERNKFYQEQLRTRKFFDGPIDGKSSTALDQALAAYKEGLKLSRSAPTDQRFFSEFLSRPIPPAPKEPFSAGPVVAASEAKPGNEAPGAQPTTASAAKTPEAVVPGIVLTTAKPAYKIREEIELAVQSQRAAYVYCYIQAPTGGIQRIYPNRTVKDPRIEADQVLALPGGSGFKITSEKPGTQKFACMAAPREIYNDLPPPLRWGDFEDVNLKSFAEIKNAFEKAGKAPVVMDEIKIEVKA